MELALAGHLHFVGSDLGCDRDRFVCTQRSIVATLRRRCSVRLPRDWSCRSKSRLDLGICNAKDLTPRRREPRGKLASADLQQVDQKYWTFPNEAHSRLMKDAAQSLGVHLDRGRDGIRAHLKELIARMG